MASLWERWGRIRAGMPYRVVSTPTSSPEVQGCESQWEAGPGALRPFLL